MLPAHLSQYIYTQLISSIQKIGAYSHKTQESRLYELELRSLNNLDMLSYVVIVYIIKVK